MRKVVFVGSFLGAILLLFSAPIIATPMPPVVECWMQVNDGEVFKWNPTVIDNGDDTFYVDPSMTMANMWEISLPVNGGVTVDPDPSVSLAVAITNLTGGPQTFTFTVVSPVAPPLPGSTLHGGSTSASIADADGSGGATLQIDPLTSQPMYRGYIDLMMGGGPVLDMLPPDVSSIVVTTPYGTNIATKTLGLGPSGPFLPSGPAMVNIALEHKFELTPADTATFNSTFVVVPEPTTLLLIGLGGLFLRRKP